MGITIYFIATSLPDRLASVRDALLLKHPCEVTIKVLESALKDVERNLRSVASASGAVPPPLFHGCSVPQLPTFTASLTTAAIDMTSSAVTNSSRSRDRSGRRGGQGAGGGGGGSGGGVASGGGGSTEVGGATRATASDSPATIGGGDAWVLQRFDFTYSSPQATPLSTHHSLSALPSDESEKPSGPYPELVGCLMYLMTCTRPDLAYPLSILARYVAPGRHRPEHMAAAKRLLYYLCSTSGMGLVLGGRSPVVLTGHADASWVDNLATQRSSQGYTFSLGSGSVSWRSTRSSSVLSSSCEAEIYAGAMAAQELRWLTYLLTDLGEPPRSPPVLYADNNAMLALCREHRLEHRTKHIALRYFLARELHQRGQLRLAYVASQANTADIFTKALQPCDHQRFCTMLGLVPTWPHLLTS
ncbi:unnamed protein product [Closterium sp. NIES-54]